MFVYFVPLNEFLWSLVGEGEGPCQPWGPQLWSQHSVTAWGHHDDWAIVFQVVVPSVHRHDVLQLLVIWGLRKLLVCAEAFLLAWCEI